MAIPNHEEIDETYKMVNEAFFEGFNAAEKQYRFLIEYVEELDKKSVEAENRHYIKIYADDEPSVKAEKLYQICGETQNKEVAEWLKKYFSLEDRPQGEWVAEDGDLWVCDKCGCVSGYKDNFCHKCGADMRGDTE